MGEHADDAINSGINQWAWGGRGARRKPRVPHRITCKHCLTRNLHWDTLPGDIPRLWTVDNELHQCPAMDPSEFPPLD